MTEEEYWEQRSQHDEAEREKIQRSRRILPYRIMAGIVVIAMLGTLAIAAIING